MKSCCLLRVRRGCIRKYARSLRLYMMLKTILFVPALIGTLLLLSCSSNSCKKDLLQVPITAVEQFIAKNLDSSFYHSHLLIRSEESYEIIESKLENSQEIEAKIEIIEKPNPQYEHLGLCVFFSGQANFPKFPCSPHQIFNLQYSICKLYPTAKSNHQKN